MTDLYLCRAEAVVDGLKVTYQAAVPPSYLVQGGDPYAAFIERICAAHVYARSGEAAVVYWEHEEGCD